ncbi:TPA: hypothetical protein ACKONR_000400 [Clostridioides difficile]|uniref:hypothetical protein n=1 Tax=Clostridioides difficile TaxID=1496 RepID=UPI0008270079|nr:hypothetical protein [Clostridioides difficile]MDV9854130.1 hypothetical protein [Clostridioides difficile]HBF1102451.1 hypothetical protein [Clostridioides difficile]HBF1291752.1 hypothetical protein [Clostridioides difficile]HBF3342983.1 hypothetical protein [Clostridioides difficile]HBF3642661.1 hypothetical protein [Clostridioides difficile]
MEKPSIYLVGEFRMKDFEIFKLMQTEDCLNESLGFYVIEDCRRRAELKDYPYLIDVYKDNPNEFDAGINLIKVHFISEKDFDIEEKEILEHVGVNLVEFKNNTSTLFYIHKNKDIRKFLNMYDENPFKLYNELLQVTELKPNVLNFKISSLSNLYQEQI